VKAASNSAVTRSVSGRRAGMRRGVNSLLDKLLALGVDSCGALDLMFPPDLAIRAWPDRSATTS
jgi:hypothetical protein